VAQVWDVRRTLERRTAALAAQYRTDEEAAQILGHAEAMKQFRDDFGRMTKHDIALHETIAAASHNLLFAQIVASFSPQINEAVPTAWRTRTTERQRSTILRRHLAIAEAIAARDPVAAEKAMDLHFDDSIKRLLDAGAGQLT
jgi:DNA-binding FadR family transcriptional regulator